MFLSRLCWIQHNCNIVKLILFLQILHLFITHRLYYSKSTLSILGTLANLKYICLKVSPSLFFWTIFFHGYKLGNFPVNAYFIFLFPSIHLLESHVTGDSCLKVRLSYFLGFNCSVLLVCQ